MIIASEISRFSRDQAEITALHNCCTSMSIEIWTLSDGRMGDCNLGIMDRLNALYRRDRRARRAANHPSAITQQVLR
jgi:DNA invertase Pin-like site-specific DNA recombinase